jgi:Kef-type K+ transport system membrane component KefB
LVAQTFVALGVIVVVARAMGLLFQRFGQPLVIGEIVGGIVLGPTVLGAISPHAVTALFPLRIRPSLDLVGQIGLSLYMFLVGLRLHVKPVRANPRMVGAISVASTALPYALAMPLAAILYSRHHRIGVHSIDETAFFLFVGTSLAITAFPVLTRILEDRRMQRTELGAIATACAAVQDVFGWLMLALVLAISTSHGGTGTVARIMAEGLACVVGIVAVSHAVAWLDRRDRAEHGEMLMPVVAALVLLCAGATQQIGLHPVFGAFVCGIVLAHRLPEATCESLSARLGPVTLGVLLPVYFISPGLHVNLRAIGTAGMAETVLIIAVACAGKIGGAYLSSRSVGLSRRQSSIMGALMNTRGLIELVVLQVALSAGILDGRLFSEFVFMAVVTTVSTPPLLRWLMRPAVGVTAEARQARLLALDPR